MFRMFTSQMFVIWGQLLIWVCWIAMLKYSNAVTVFFYPSCTFLYTGTFKKKIYITMIRCLVACNDYCKIRQRFVLVDLRGKNVVKRAVSICSNGYVEIL